ncbi:hypothetical protein [Corynebacterium uterequi]|uniref:Secreted protein n=1 Tax=Corynebacterium uterequi TaxID=1072256 RepID=A0A0G3HDM2_9CORY|nr:hypothetical protein [Corynebacterium uterequi]AKK11409.1 hypothetical protein CUTER_07100 [Corynebacterium uterequi]
MSMSPALALLAVAVSLTACSWPTGPLPEGFPVPDAGEAALIVRSGDELNSHIYPERELLLCGSLSPSIGRIDGDALTFSRQPTGAWALLGTTTEVDLSEF